LIPVVDFLCSQVADSLEKGTEHEDEYMISEKELLVNRFDDLLWSQCFFPTNSNSDSSFSVLIGSFLCQKIWGHSIVEHLVQEL
jgi:hypothetical protein